MITELDIWRAASVVIEHHGEDAEIIAEKLLDRTSFASFGPVPLTRCERGKQLRRRVESSRRQLLYDLAVGEIDGLRPRAPLPQ